MQAVLIGRGHELTTLQLLLDGARRGAGGALLVHGEPGIGKSALVDDVVESCGLRVLRATGYEAEADLPFATLGDLLRPLLGHLAEIPAAQAEAIERAFGLAPGNAFDPATIDVATLSLLRAAVREGPLLVVVDDLPWADTGSQGALLHLARRAAGLPLAVVLVARTHDTTAAMAQLPSLAVQALSADDAIALLRDDAPEIAGAVVASLVDRARGNPLALHELLRGLSAEQRTGIAELDDPIPIADEVVLAYRQRVDELPPATRLALLVAVAEGRGELASVGRALAVLATDVSAFDAAERDNLVALQDGVVRFRHPLVRSVVYQTATAADRRAAHRALAAVEHDPDRQAWHLSGSIVGPDAEVATAMARMAERALSRGADAAAARALMRAGELTAAADEQGQFYARAARAANRGGDLPLASRLLAMASPLVAHEPTASADLVMLDADLRMRRGDLERAYLDLAARAEAIAGVDRRRAMVMLLMAARLHVYRMEGEEALATVRRALELAGDDPRDLLQMASLTMTATMAGDPSARQLALATADAAMGTKRGHLHTMSLAWPLVWLGENKAARRFLVWATGVQRDGGFLSYLPQSLLPAAELDFREGRWNQARAAALEAHQVCVETNQPVDAALAAGVLARIEAAHGDEDNCMTNYRAAVEGDLGSGLHAGSAFAAAGVGHLALSCRRYDEAVTQLGRAASAARRGRVGELGLLLVHADLIEALIRNGDVPAATRLTDELEEHATRTRRSPLLAMAARCRGLLAPADEFAAHFESALQDGDDDAPFERARTELCFGERLHRVNRRAEARAHLRRAADTFAELGAKTWAASASALLRATGGERRQLDAGTMAELTQRERDVARQVAGGATNKEVAQGLFVNEKTVEFHLGNVYRKLGLRSRAELARLFADDEPT